MEAFREEYEKLWTQQDAEETPFVSKYAARALAEQQVEREVGNLENVFLIKTMLGRNFLHTEQPSDAERLFMDALSMWKTLPLKNSDVLVGLLLDCATLYAQRMNYKAALPLAAFARHVSADRSQKILCDFQLARIFGALGFRETSAYYCAQTLAGQWQHNANGDALAGDFFSVADYVGNVSDLAVYFVNQGSLWTAEYLLHGALAASEISGNPELVARCNRDLARFYRSRLEFTRHVSESSENEALGIWRSMTSPDGHSLPTIDYELRLPYDISDSESIPSFIALETLTEERVSERETVERISDCPGVQFEQWFVQPAVTLASEVHSRAVARLVKINAVIVGLFKKSGIANFSVCGARDILTKREIFKLGLHFANQAMNFFKLDGWATEHLVVVQELSHLWRELATAEMAAGEPKKRLISMLDRRYTLLDGVVFQVSPQVFADFYKSFLYELGDICGELYELKACDEDAGHNAVRYYELFIETFVSSEKIPIHELRGVVAAKLSAARMLMRLRGTKLEDQLEYNRKSLRLCEEVLTLVKDDPDLEAAPETRLAREITTLLPTKISKIISAMN